MRRASSSKPLGLAATGLIGGGFVGRRVARFFVNRLVTDKVEMVKGAADTLAEVCKPAGFAANNDRPQL